MKRGNRLGAATIEYVAMLALIILVSVGSLAVLASGVSRTMNLIYGSNKVEAAVPPNSVSDPS